MIARLLQWIGNFFTIAGVWTLAEKKRSSLILFGIGNTCWMYYAISVHLWSLVVLEIILTTLDIKA